jgi:hypothetical protein
MSHYNTESDADDYCALANYLMLANKFNTVRIVLGSDAAPAEKSTNAADEFRKLFLPAYKHDVKYWNSENGIGGYPSADEIAATVRLASTQGKRFDPAESYKNIKNLPATVRELVEELKSDKYSARKPIVCIGLGACYRSGYCH